jgi:hypothetical protein
MLAAVFLSDWLCRGHTFFQGPSIKGEILLASMLGWFIIRRGRLGLINWLPWAGVLILAYSFFRESGGRVLYSDDHSVFMYRLQLLKENFPAVPFYNPLWNAGIRESSFYNTGVVGVFLLNLPLIALFPIEQVYNVIVAVVVFSLPPLCVYYAAKLERLRPPVPAVAAALSLAMGLDWYRWALKYGTIGFVLAAGIMPLGLVLASRIVSREASLTKMQAVVFVAAGTLMLLWPLSGAVFIPLGLWGLWQLPRILRKSSVLPALLGFAVINSVWLGIFLSTSDVGEILRAGGGAAHSAIDDGAGRTADLLHGEERFRHTRGGMDLGRSLKALRDLAGSSNPLIVFLALPGLFLMRREAARHFALTFLWLAFVGAVLVPLKPQLELDRMLIFLLMCACLPTALAIDRVTAAAAGARSWLRPALGALILGFLLTGPLAAAAIVRNRSLEQVRFADQIVFDMAAAIKAHAGRGRVWFSGCVLHELSDGHLAPLAHLARVPLMASSQVHNIWWYTSALPPYFEQRAASGGVEEYLDLFNISAVFAHDRKWRRYFDRRPERYRLVWDQAPFRLYQRIGFEGSYFLEGRGEVQAQSLSSITLKLSTPDAVIRFNHQPFLTAAGCELAGREAAPGIRFIALKGCPLDTPITIRALPPHKWALQ